MRTWNILTRSGSLYRVTEENGTWRFGALEVPTQGYGTRFLGAGIEIAAPVAWPLRPGDRLACYAPDIYTPDGPFVVTSPIEQITEVGA